MQGIILKSLLEKLKDLDIDISVINNLLNKDEILLKKISTINDKDDIYNVLKIIFTNYNSVSEIINAINIYLKCPYLFKKEIIEILTSDKLAQRKCNLVLVKEILFIHDYRILEFKFNLIKDMILSNNIDDIDIKLVINCLKELNTSKKSYITQYIYNALKEYLFNLKDIISFKTFREVISYINNAKSLEELELIKKLLSKIISKEEFDNLLSILNIISNSRIEITKTIEDYILEIYEYSLKNIELKNKLLEIILDEKINIHEFKLIVSLSKEFNYSYEIIHLIKVLYNISVTDEDKVVVLKIVNDINYNDTCYKFYKFISESFNIAKEDLKLKLFEVLKFDYDEYDKQIKFIQANKTNNNKIKRNKMINEYIEICKIYGNNEIAPSSLIRNKNNKKIRKK